MAAPRGGQETTLSLRQRLLAPHRKIYPSRSGSVHSSPSTPTATNFASSSLVLSCCPPSTWRIYVAADQLRCSPDLAQVNWSTTEDLDDDAEGGSFAAHRACCCRHPKVERGMGVACNGPGPRSSRLVGCCSRCCKCHGCRLRSRQVNVITS